VSGPCHSFVKKMSIPIFKHRAVGMDEGRKRVIGIIAGIIMARNLDRADDLFGGPQGSPRNRQDDCRCRAVGRTDYEEGR
jgi:hypothetical protein